MWLSYMVTIVDIHIYMIILTMWHVSLQKVMENIGSKWLWTYSSMVTIVAVSITCIQLCNCIVTRYVVTVVTCSTYYMYVCTYCVFLLIWIPWEMDRHILNSYIWCTYINWVVIITHAYMYIVIYSPWYILACKQLHCQH